MICHILTTAPQTEFHVRDELHALGYAALVPVEFKWKTHAFGRKLKAPCPQKVPRLPGYVFASFDYEPNWYELERVRGWTGIIHVDGRPAAIPPSQFAALEALSVPIQAIPSKGRKLSPGDRVKIKRGAFAELDAVVETIRKGKVVATVHLFGRPSSVTFKSNDIQLHPA